MEWSAHLPIVGGGGVSKNIFVFHMLIYFIGILEVLSGVSKF